ncbi:MAG: accessory gene regulator B family protein [Anaerotruncus sp.]|nr:MAG: accessory gene regulator B family protein [Anaerotruncus sp.]
MSLIVFIESVIFLCSFFQSIRRYAGGYHAKTETKCEILSTISIALCVFVVKITRVYDIKIFFYLFLSCIFTTLVFILCPLDTPEKKLTKKEKKHFRKISWIILTFILTVVTISYLFELNILFASSCMSLILEGIFGIVRKGARTKNNKLKKYCESIYIKDNIL